MSAGQRLRQALAAECPLQVVGTINAYHALLAQASGYRAIYLSGSGVAAASLGVPDLAISTLDDVLTDARRIADVCDVPILVDVDTGFGPTAFNIARTTRSFIKAGAAGLHIEDQTGAKRCGHRPGKELVDVSEMVDRIGAVLDARTDSEFYVIARTDALAVEGDERTLERARAYVDAGADAIFLEAATDLAQYAQFAHVLNVPILANMTEFGLTPLWTLEELRAADVGIALYPLSAFRAMNAAALEVYKTLREAGTQRDLLPRMQSRADLYRFLDYERHERALDRYNH